MEVITETLWKRCLSTPTKPPAKNSNICLSETAYQHKGTRKKCKKTNQAAIIQWQRQCLMDKPHRKPWPKSKTSDISKQGPSPLHHTFLLGRARFTAQPLSALVDGDARSASLFSLPSREVFINGLEPNIFIWIVSSSFVFFDISLKWRLATVFLIGIAHSEPKWPCLFVNSFRMPTSICVRL